MKRIVSATLTLTLAFSFILAQAESAQAAVTGYDSAYAGESAFLNKAAGESGQFSAIFTNTGTQGWFKSQVGLLACLDDKTTCNVAPEEAAYAKSWFSATVYATVSADTAPGQNAFFIYEITVPAGTAGDTAAVFNGDVGLIATGALFHPEGYFQSNTTPTGLAGAALAISPTTANVAVNAQQQFTASNVPTGATAVWSVTGGCGAVTQTGLFVATATNSATQPCSVVVTAGGQTASAAIAVYGPAASITCSTSPSSIVANGSSTSVVSGTLKDANGNTVANGTSAITFNNNTATIATPTAVEIKAAVSGVASKTYTSTTATGTAQISLSSGTLTGCQASFTTTALGAATKLTAAFSPTTIAADSVSASRLRVEVTDVDGNRRVSDNTTAVTVTRDPASASFCSPASSGPFAVTAGRFDFTVTSTSTPGACSYTATATALTSATATLTTTVVGAPNKLVVSSSDSPKPAGAVAADNTITVVVELQDANGVRVTGTAGQSIGILSDVPSTCTGTGDSTVNTGTSSTGAGRSTFTYITATAQTCSIEYSVPSNTNVAKTTTSVTWTPGPATNLTCVFSPLAAGSTTNGAIVADGSSTATATVTIRDANANKVSDSSYSITFSRAGGTSTTLLTSNPQTTSGGTTTFTVRSTTSPGTDTYTAAITSGSSPTLTTPTSPACSISVQTTLP